MVGEDEKRKGEESGRRRNIQEEEELESVAEEFLADVTLL
jgi:hypothetical protein